MTLKEFIPREHGAWAMWIVPMLSSAVITGFPLSFFALVVCFTLLYTVHHPVVLMIRRQVHMESRDARLITVIAAPAVLIGIVLVVFYGRVWLLVFGAIEAAVFASSIRAFLDREQRSFINELTIVAALTLSAPAAYYTVTGSIDGKAFLLYVLNFLFFGSSVFYVKMKIEFLRCKGVWRDEARRSRTFMIVYHLFLAAAVLAASTLRMMSPWVLLGFVPLLIQVGMGTLSKETRMNFTRLGVALIVQSVFFLAALGLFMR